jgi:hypothetical protein
MPKSGTAIPICRPPRIFAYYSSLPANALKNPFKSDCAKRTQLSSILVHHLSWLGIYQLLSPLSLKEFIIKGLTWPLRLLT